MHNYHLALMRWERAEESNLIPKDNETCDLTVCPARDIWATLRPPLNLSNYKFSLKLYKYYINIFGKSQIVKVQYQLEIKILLNHQVDKKNDLQYCLQHRESD